MYKNASISFIIYIVSQLILATILTFPAFITLGGLLLVTIFAIVLLYGTQTPTLSKTQIKGVLFIFVLLMIAQITGTFILQKLGIVLTNQESISYIIKNHFMVAAAYSCILAPIIEELMFRKTVFETIKNPHIATVVSALLFGFAHGFTILPTLIYGTIGLFLIWAYRKYGIEASILLHMLNNIAAMLLMIL